MWRQRYTYLRTVFWVVSPENIHQLDFHTSEEQENSGGGTCDYLWKCVDLGWGVIHDGNH